MEKDRSPDAASKARHPLDRWQATPRPILLPLFPDHTCYVEPFCGAAAMFFLKPPSKVEVLNDINGELVNLYRVLKHHPEEFLRQFKWALSSRQMFEWQQQSVPQTLTDLQRAARFYYLQHLAFGGKVCGQTFGVGTTSRTGLNLLRLEEDLSAAHLRLASALIEHLPWLDVVRRYDRAHTLFFCDPPYWRVEGYGVEFPMAEYEALASAASTIAGKMIITVNDHPDMRRVFAGLHIRTAPIKYTVGTGVSRSAKRTELIIRSW